MFPLRRYLCRREWRRYTAVQRCGGAAAAKGGGLPAALRGAHVLDVLPGGCTAGHGVHGPAHCGSCWGGRYGQYGCLTSLGAGLAGRCVRVSSLISHIRASPLPSLMLPNCVSLLSPLDLRASMLGPPTSTRHTQDPLPPPSHTSFTLPQPSSSSRRPTPHWPPCCCWARYGGSAPYSQTPRNRKRQQQCMPQWTGRRRRAPPCLSGRPPPSWPGRCACCPGEGPIIEPHPGAAAAWRISPPRSAPVA